MSIESSPSPEEIGLLNQFNEVSHQVLDVALARYTSGRMNPALDGKPVNLLRFGVDRINAVTISEFEPNPIVKEVLAACVLGPQNLQTLPKFPLYNQLSIEEKAQHRTLVMGADAVRVQRNFSLLDQVPQQATWAGYTAYRMQRVEDETTTDLGVVTYELPNSQDEFERMFQLTSALFFARDALTYVFSSDLKQVDRERKHGDIRHKMSFLMLPVLGSYLNGHESPAFLREFRDAMQSKLDAARSHFFNLHMQFIDPEPEAIKRAEQCEQALRNVKAILAKLSE